MADIILVMPRSGMDFASSVAPPHALLCVAAPLIQAGYNVKIIDQRVDGQWREHLKEELNHRPVFVGVSAMTGTQIHFAIETAKIVRQKGNTPIVWGGAHCTFLPQQIIDSGWADYVCVGEVDETIVDITSKIQNGKAEKIIKSLLPNVENLLPTPYYLLDVKKYIHPDMYVKNGLRTMDIGQTSRGCPFMCGFCSSATIRERKWRAMSAEKAIDMITNTVKRYNLTGFWLRDDEFYINSKRAAQISEGIMPLNVRWYTSGTRVDVLNKTSEEQVALYRRAGAHTLKFGAESGSERILKMINKGITPEDTLEANRKCMRHDITPAFSLICGFPTETFEEVNMTIDLARKLRKENPRAQFETMGMYRADPGTPLWDMAMSFGLKPPDKLEGWADWIGDEYDLKGIRLPWFCANDRKALANLTYISMLSNAVPNVIDSLENKFFSELLRLGYYFPHKYYQWRFFNKHYRNAYELPLVRWARREVFYKGRKVIK